MSGEAFDRIVDALEEHGYRVKVKGTKAKAQCPCHDDDDPSLDIAINEANNGVVMVCRACGANGAAVVKALGLSERALYDEPRTNTRQPEPTDYRYTDANNDVLFISRRYYVDGNKRFVIVHPDGRTKGKPPDAPWVPYRLPQLIAAPDDDERWIAEGEKDVHALVNAGVCATTNPMGAGKWDKVAPIAEPVLKGKRLVVVCDRDEPGYRHARQVAAWGLDVGSSVRVVEPAKGKDAHDHLVTHQLTVADFLTLADGFDAVRAWVADESEPPTNDDTETPRSMLVDGFTFLFGDVPDVEIRWGTGSDVLWASGESLMLVGPPGVGKTTLAGQLVDGLIGGRDRVLDHPIVQARRVLYLAMDRPRQVRRALKRHFARDQQHMLTTRLIVQEGPLPADIGKHPEILCELAMTNGCDVIVMDSLKDAAVKLSDDETGNNINRAIQLCNVNGIDVLVLHHQRKATGGEDTKRPTTLDAAVYGSAWISAGAGSVIQLWGETGSETVGLWHLKPVAEPVGPLTIEHDHITGTSRIVGGFNALTYLRSRGLMGATVAEAAQAEHGKPIKSTSKEWKATERRLRGLVRDGLATTTGGQGRSADGTFDTVRYHAVEPVVQLVGGT